MGLRSRWESEGTRERKERGEKCRDGRNKRLTVMTHEQKVGCVGLYCIDTIGYPLLSSMDEARQGGLNTSTLRTQAVWETMCATPDSRG